MTGGAGRYGHNGAAWERAPTTPVAGGQPVQCGPQSRAAVACVTGLPRGAHQVERKANPARAPRETNTAPVRPARVSQAGAALRSGGPNRVRTSAEDEEPGILEPTTTSRTSKDVANAAAGAHEAGGEARPDVPVWSAQAKLGAWYGPGCGLRPASR